MEERAELLAANPDVYYVTEHFEGFSGVLVRLEKVGRGELKDLLGMADKFVKGVGEAGRRKRAERGCAKMYCFREVYSWEQTRFPRTDTLGSIYSNCFTSPACDSLT